MILRPRQTIVRILGEGAIKYAEDELKTAFIALAAPSFEGKTQAAFVMQEAIPLYFPMIVPNPTSRHYLQAIYRNYLSLSEAIKDYAVSDLNDIIKFENSSRRSLTQTVGSYESITASLISTNLKNLPWIFSYSG